LFLTLLQQTNKQNKQNRGLLRLTALQTANYI